MIVIMIIREIISQTQRKQLESNQFNFSVAYGLANRAITVLACLQIQDTSGGLEPPLLCIFSTLSYPFIFAVCVFIKIIYRKGLRSCFSFSYAKSHTSHLQTASFLPIRHNTVLKFFQEHSQVLLVQLPSRNFLFQLTLHLL